MDEALRMVRPTASGKIVLLQEGGDGVQERPLRLVELAGDDLLIQTMGQPAGQFAPGGRPPSAKQKPAGHATVAARR